MGKAEPRAKVDQYILKRCFTCKTEKIDLLKSIQLFNFLSVSEGKIQLEIMLIINTSVFRNDAYNSNSADTEF